MLLDPYLEVRDVVSDLQPLGPAAQVLAEQELVQAVRADVVEQLGAKESLNDGYKPTLLKSLVVLTWIL